MKHIHLQHRRLNSSAGFTLVELIGVIVLAGTLALGAIVYVGNANAQATLNTKLRNAQTINNLISMASQANATIAAGASNNIDTTSATTAIGSLNTGFTVNSITFGLKPSVAHPASYTISGTAPNVTVASDGLTTTLP